MVYRLNPNLGMGRVIKKIEVPTSKSLDDEDTSYFTKFKVLFKNDIIKILHAVDLVHYIFQINERVLTKKGVGVINSRQFLIEKGLISYEVLFSNGKLEQIHEFKIISKYETPIKRIISKNRIDPPNNFLLKYWANLFNSYYTSYQIKCITNSRLSLMPHQINITHRLSEEHFPRVILADEVGLGKTIEAGIFIKEMMARGLAERILIVVPATLVKQWQFEMSNKFNLFFTIYDGKKIKEIRKMRYLNLENPFYYDHLIITSLQFARNPSYSDLLSQISWDIVVFDEAHHLRRYLINAVTGNYRETRNYILARNLSQNCESLLLLTATPLQLYSFELYSLIELIHPEAFENFSDFEHFRKDMPFINLLVVNINQIDKLNTFEMKNTIKLLKNLGYVNKKENDENIFSNLQNDAFKSNLLNRIERDHTLSKFLIRNRKKNVFPEEFLSKRIVKTISVEPKKEELDIYNEIRLYLAKIYNSTLRKENIGIGFVITTLQKLLTSSKFAILKSIERRLEHIENLKSLKNNHFSEETNELFEEEFIDLDIDNDQRIDVELVNQEKMLLNFYEKLNKLAYDSKADILIDLINQIYASNPNEKVLIFTQFVDTLFFLKDLIEAQDKGITVQTFYGGLDKEQKDYAVEIFRNSTNFSVLLSTEVGGEGRNFQFCRVLINYDLPWNPMKLEQRIGRLDRIGQESREIFIYNFVIEHTIETDIIFALNKRINLFEESIGLLEPILGKIEKDMKEIIFSESGGRKRKKLNELYRTLEEEIKKAKEIEMQLDDLMIDKKSFQMDSLISSLASCQEVELSHNELNLFIKHFFDLDNHRFGFLESLEEEGGIQTVDGKIFLTRIQLNNDLIDKLGKKVSHEYIGTFNVELAKEREEIDFFALGHPIIDNILSFCRDYSFKGVFTKLNVKKGKLPKYLESIPSSYNELYLFIFTVKFQGYIIEHQLSAIVIDRNGNNIDKMANFLLDIENYADIYQFGDPFNDKINLNNVNLEYLSEEAKKHIKWKTSQWKREIKKLNDKIFKLEQNKKKKIYTHKKNALNHKLESLNQKLERNVHKRPTERQKENIMMIEDEKKKKNKRKKIQEIEEEIDNTQKDINKTRKKLDDLSFEYEDLKNDMIKRNRGKYYTNLLSCGIIRFID